MITRTILTNEQVALLKLFDVEENNLLDDIESIRKNHQHHLYNIIRFVTEARFNATDGGKLFTSSTYPSLSTLQAAYQQGYRLSVLDPHPVKATGCGCSALTIEVSHPSCKAKKITTGELGKLWKILTEGTKSEYPKYSLTDIGKLLISTLNYSKNMRIELVIDGYCKPTWTKMEDAEGISLQDKFYINHISKSQIKFLQNSLQKSFNDAGYKNTSFRLYFDTYTINTGNNSYFGSDINKMSLRAEVTDPNPATLLKIDFEKVMGKFIDIINQFSNTPEKDIIDLSKNHPDDIDVTDKTVIRLRKNISGLFDIIERALEDADKASIVSTPRK